MAADRVPDGRSLLRPPSYCESCLRPLASIDMVPVFSYLWLRGKCRDCKASVPIRVVLVEAVTGALFVAALSQYGIGLDFVIISACLSLLVVVSLIDLEHGLILNSMVVPSIVLLMVIGPFWNEIEIERSFFGDETVVASMANSYLSGLGAFLAFLVIAIVAPGGMGGGDVKFAAVMGLMVGFPGILLAIWVSAVGGGIIAISLVLTGKKGRKDVIPFGPFMALGAAVVLIAGPELIEWYKDLADAISGT